MIDMVEIFWRLGLAAGAGMLLGLDREARGRAAGLRTHGLVSLSAALVMLSALLLREQFGGAEEVDPLRALQAVASVIGLIAAGTIIATSGKVRGLTSATSIWLAAALGITAGAGQLTLTLLGAVLGGLLLAVVRMVERFVPGSDKK